MNGVRVEIWRETRGTRQNDLAIHYFMIDACLLSISLSLCDCEGTVVLASERMQLCPFTCSGHLGQLFWVRERIS